MASSSTAFTKVELSAVTSTVHSTRTRLIHVESTGEGEVVQQFLSFVYSGWFKNKDDEANDNNGFVQVWVEIIPPLVHMAGKVNK